MSYRKRLETPDAEQVEQTESNTIAPQEKISRLGVIAMLTLFGGILFF